MTDPPFPRSISGVRKIPMRVLPLAVLALALLVAPSAAATHAEDGLPYSTRVVDARVDALRALADAPADDAAFGNATAEWEGHVDAVRGLAPSAADVLAGYYEALVQEARGNASDVRSLARAAAQSWERDVRPAVEAWEDAPAFVTSGEPKGTPEREGAARVPLVLVHPPAGGVGAFDVRVTVTGARVVDATLATGQGETSVDAANGTARLAAFDAKALGGLGSSAPSVIVGWVVVEPARDASVPVADALVGVRVAVVELADAEGARVPAVGVARGVAALAAVDDAAAGAPLKLGLVVAAGAIAAGGAMFLVRKLVKV